MRKLRQDNGLEKDPGRQTQSQNYEELNSGAPVLESNFDRVHTPSFIHL